MKKGLRDLDHRISRFRKIKTFLINTHSTRKSFGKIIRLSGDDLRQILNLKGYSKRNRKNIGYIYHNVCKRLSNNGVNILIDVVCLFKDIRKQNRKYLKNYIEVYIETDFKKVIRKKNKPFYRKKLKMSGEKI